MHRLLLSFPQLPSSSRETWHGLRVLGLIRLRDLGIKVLGLAGLSYLGFGA